MYFCDDATSPDSHSDTCKAQTRAYTVTHSSCHVTYSSLSQSHLLIFVSQSSLSQTHIFTHLSCHTVILSPVTQSSCHTLIYSSLFHCHLACHTVTLSGTHLVKKFRMLFCKHVWLFDTMINDTWYKHRPSPEQVSRKIQHQLWCCRHGWAKI